MSADRLSRRTMPGSGAPRGVGRRRPRRRTTRCGRSAAAAPRRAEPCGDPLRRAFKSTAEEEEEALEHLHLFQERRALIAGHIAPRGPSARARLVPHALKVEHVTAGAISRLARVGSRARNRRDARQRRQRVELGADARAGRPLADRARRADVRELRRPRAGERRPGASGARRRASAARSRGATTGAARRLASATSRSRRANRKPCAGRRRRGHPSGARRTAARRRGSR